jgi:hypothetical protein
LNTSIIENFIKELEKEIEIITRKEYNLMGATKMKEIEYVEYINFCYKIIKEEEKRLDCFFFQNLNQKVIKIVREELLINNYNYFFNEKSVLVIENYFYKS